MGKIEEKEVSILNFYKNLAKDRTSHKTLLKDKTGVLYATTTLEHKNIEVVKSAIEFFDLLIQNKNNHPKLLSTFGIIEALETLTIRLRNIDCGLSEKVRQMIFNLNQTDPPAFNTRSRSSTTKPKSIVYAFHVIGLNESTKSALEEVLIHLKGVISLVLDTDHQKCTVRVLPKLSARSVVYEIYEKCSLRARYIVRTPQNTEIFRELLDVSNTSLDNLPPYLSETNPDVEPNAVTNFNFKKYAKDWLETTTSFLNNTFFW